MPDLPHVLDVIRPAVVARRPAVPRVENREDLDAVLKPGALAAVAAFVEDQVVDVESVDPFALAVFPEVRHGLVAPSFDPRPGVRQLHRVDGWSATRHAPRSADEWMPQVLASGDPIAVLEWLGGPLNDARLDPVHVWIARRRRTQVAVDRSAVERTHARRNEIARLRQLEDAVLPLALPVIREVLDDLRRAVQEYPISPNSGGTNG